MTIGVHRICFFLTWILCQLSQELLFLFCKIHGPLWKVITCCSVWGMELSRKPTGCWRRELQWSRTTQPPLSGRPCKTIIKAKQQFSAEILRQSEGPLVKSYGGHFKLERGDIYTVLHPGMAGSEQQCNLMSDERVKYMPKSWKAFCAWPCPCMKQQ